LLLACYRILTALTKTSDPKLEESSGEVETKKYNEVLSTNIIPNVMENKKFAIFNRYDCKL
jgi:hypothetical protein